MALMDAQRDLTFLLRRGRFDSEQVEWVQELCATSKPCCRTTRS